MKWLALALVVACDPPPLEMSEYACPTAGTQLTYANFGATFLGVSCNTCHGAAVGNRHGAPELFRFDTLDEVQHHRDRIFVRAAASNTSMPPGPVDPATDERDRLAEWLVCGAP